MLFKKAVKATVAGFLSALGLTVWASAPDGVTRMGWGSASVPLTRVISKRNDAAVMQQCGRALQISPYRQAWQG